MKYEIMNIMREIKSTLSVNEYFLLDGMNFFSSIASSLVTSFSFLDSLWKSGPSGFSELKSSNLLIINTIANSTIVARTKNKEVMRKPLKAFKVAPDGLLLWK